MFKVIELSKYVKSVDDSGYSEPFTICFIYPKNGLPVIVKGMTKQIKKYVKDNFPEAIVRYTFWHKGKSRGLWSFTCKDKYVFWEKGKYEISLYKNGNLSKLFSLKRVPHKWIPEYDL